jgi:Flp pilus assembly protein TadD
MYGTFAGSALAKFIADSSASIKLDLDLATVYYARGRAYEKAGDKAKADEDFAQAKKLGHKEGVGS